IPFQSKPSPCDVAVHGGGAMSGGCPPHYLRPNRCRSCLIKVWWSIFVLDLLCLSFNFGSDLVQSTPPGRVVVAPVAAPAS
ncbi:hypothetical protein A2U01_0047123, partial [Trifolium medium]|nr:hypothetical protein [Trifolium medium]